jgi:hypothetical protein
VGTKDSYPAAEWIPRVNVASYHAEPFSHDVTSGYDDAACSTNGRRGGLLR